MQQPSATTYALLGLLDARSWTGYELTTQLRRSLRFVWPSSEGHLYREQKRLVDRGWATVTPEPVGKRHRKRYTITAAGRRAMREWLRTEPGEPRIEIEGLVRMFYGNQGSVEDMVRSMEATSRAARSMLDTLLGFVDEYLEPDGPLAILERGRGSSGQEPPVFHGRPQFPERLHVVALVLEVVTTLLADLEETLMAERAEVTSWPSTTDPGVTSRTRERLERIQRRGRAARPRTLDTTRNASRVPQEGSQAASATE
ncbi:MAG: PadR family transcriptional regulator [Actinomycetota bacterium]